MSKMIADSYDPSVLRTAFVCECYYDQETTGFVAVRLVTKNGAATVFEQPDRLTAVAAKCCLQPYSICYRGWDIPDGLSSDAVWGMVQYLDTNTLTIPLLTSATARINNAMQLAVSKILGDAEA